MKDSHCLFCNQPEIKLPFYKIQTFLYPLLHDA
jgi:hypothetical protein